MIFGDMTIKQIKEICEEHLDCDNCPLYNKGARSTCGCVLSIDFPKDFNLEKEVSI